MNADVFVSYSSQNRDEVVKIVGALRKAGVSVWMDEGGIEAAALWSESIVEAINECKVLVMMVSRHSTDSQNVVKEVMLASESGKTILPVYLESSEIPTRLKYQLTGIQHLEVYNYEFDAFKGELLRGLVRSGVKVEGYESTAVPAPYSSAHKKNRGRDKSNQVVQIVGLLLVGFVLGLAAYGIIGGGSKVDESAATGSTFTKRLKLELANEVKVPVGFDNPFAWSNGNSISLSPSGRYLAYHSISNDVQTINVRDLSGFSKDKQLTEARGLRSLMFSPDEGWIAFFENEKLKKISIANGESSVLAECRVPGNGCWADDGYIYFIHELGRKLSRVNANGADMELLFEGVYQEGANIGKPFVINNASGVLMTFPGRGINRNYAPIKYLDFKTKGLTDIGVSGIWPHYHESGHLFFAKNGNIWCVPFDPSNRKIKGSPTVIVRGVSMNTTWENANYSVSKSGAIAYFSGRDESLGVPAWVNMKGEVEMIPMPEQFYGIPDISPDGKKLAIQVAANKDDIWVYDIESWEGTRLTSEGSNGWPIWSKDSSSVVFVSRPLEKEEWSLYSKRINSVEKPKQVWQPGKGLMPSSWHPKDNLLAVNFESDIWFIDWSKEPLTGDKFTGEEYLEWGGLFSPDGNWLAYVSDKTGVNLSYVQSIIDKDTIYQIGGENYSEVRWSHDGSRLYSIREGDIIQVEFEPGNPNNPIGEDKFLFHLKYIENPGISYDVHPDGDRFLFIVPKTPYEKVKDIRLILDFESELKTLF
jgi:Tol biopolymer transport system component